MGMPKVYLLTLSALMLVYVCVGANLRLKRSESEDPNIDAEGRCIKDRNWQEDCNSCWCEANYVPACTLKGCINLPIPTVPTTEPEKDKTTDKKCVPGSNWKEDCNSCFCTDDGASACTEVGCVTLTKV